METKSVKDIMEALEKLGTAIQPYAIKGWQIYLKQAYISAGQDILIGIICATITIILYRAILKSEDEIITDTTSIFLVISGVLGMFFLVSGLGTLINPEYYVLKSILGK